MVPSPVGACFLPCADGSEGLFPQYGFDAFGAATGSRQLPRADKPVDVPVSLFRTGVQFPPSPYNNQPTLKSDIEDYVQTAVLRATMDSAQTSERGHGRKEIRTAFTTDDVSWQPGGRQWPALTCIGAVCIQFEDKNGKSEQWHYSCGGFNTPTLASGYVDYISSRNLSAKALLHHARQGWSVETMRWLLDVLFGEDGCRIQTKTAQQNLNMVRKLGS